MTKILQEFNDIGEREAVPIQFLKQPSKSPDMNALDLGAWASLAAGVSRVKCNRAEGERIIDRIIFFVMERWNNWNSVTKLENLFQTKSRIMKTIVEVKGSNDYKIPRSQRSHKNDTPSYIPRNESRRNEEEEEKEEEDEEGKKEDERMNLDEEQGESEDKSEVGDSDEQEIFIVIDEKEFQSSGDPRRPITNDIIEFWEKRQEMFK